METSDKVKTSLTISKELHKNIKLLAVMEDCDVSKLYEEALRDLITKRKFKTTNEDEKYSE